MIFLALMALGVLAATGAGRRPRGAAPPEPEPEPEAEPRPRLLLAEPPDVPDVRDPHQERIDRAIEGMARAREESRRREEERRRAGLGPPREGRAARTPGEEIIVGRSYWGGGGAFTLEDAAKPFLVNENVIWRALPGEELAFDIPFNPRTSPKEPRRGRERDIERLLNRAGTPDAYWLLFGRNVYPQLANLAIRAFSRGHRWVRDTGGVGGWSVWERGSIKGFIVILKRWKRELIRDAPVMRGAEDVARRALLLEVNAAIGALESFSEILKVAMAFDLTERDIGLAETQAWFAGRLDQAQTFAGALRGEAGALRQNQIVQIIDEASGLSRYAGVVMRNLRGTMRQYIDAAKQAVIEIATDLISSVGITIPADVLPIAGTIARAWIQAMQHAFRVDKPPGLNWKRGQLNYYRRHLEAYSQLMYRAMLQHRARLVAHGIRGGD